MVNIQDYTQRGRLTNTRATSDNGTLLIQAEFDRFFL